MALNQDRLAALYNTKEPTPNAAPGMSKEPVQTPSQAGADEPEQVKSIPIGNLMDFPKGRYNRYRIHQGEKMEELVNSIRLNGILQPIVARPLGDGQYQVVDGRNRREAAKLAGYEEVPCIIRDLDDKEALRQLNYLNEQYRELLPSEKAFAYQLEFEQASGQGFRADLTSYHAVTKLNEESRMTKWRYRQLTRLCIDGYLDAVDDNLINLNAGVSVASLNEGNQLAVYQFFFEELPHGQDGMKVAYRDAARQITPAIAGKLKQMEEESKPITEDTIQALFTEVEPEKHSFPSVKIRMRPLRKKYPALMDLGQKEVEHIINDALEAYFSRLGSGADTS